MPSDLTKNTSKMRFVDFFAGSGLVTEALKEQFKAVWANDIDPIKSHIYCRNHGNEYFVEESITQVHGEDIPDSELWWASFPCQDLSLAGKNGGIDSERSGLVWHWHRLLLEVRDRQPPLIVLENVAGLLTADNGKSYQLLHNALSKNGYRVGPLILDAIHWVPQSRVRVFIVAAKRELNCSGLHTHKPSWCHPKLVQTAIQDLDDAVLWNLPKPPKRNTTLQDLVDFQQECDPEKKSARDLALITDNHTHKFAEHYSKDGLLVAPGYKRMRSGSQRLELRFDGVAGCLRTPSGGSSRQFLVFAGRDGTPSKSRLLTVAEAAKLMGAPENYELPGSYNDGYKAMGDAVAVPVGKYLSEHLLEPLLGSNGFSGGANSLEAKRMASYKIDDALKELETFARKGGYRGKSPLCVGLAVTREAMNKGLPLDPKSLLTAGGGQVSVLGKPRIQAILKDHGIDRTFAEEGGRTSRGSIGKMERYVEFLNTIHESGFNDLEQFERWWVDRVRAFFAGKPMKLSLDTSKATKKQFQDILEQAQKRQKDMPGTTYVGTVLQHLVGAKLEIMHLTQKIVHHSASAADASTDRGGDFLVGNTAIHVTTTPTDSLLRKCRRNIEDGLKPMIITTKKGEGVAEFIADSIDIGDRVDIQEVTSFLAINVQEKSQFEVDQHSDVVRGLIDHFNRIVDETETDPSLKIECSK